MDRIDRRSFLQKSGTALGWLALAKGGAARLAADPSQGGSGGFDLARDGRSLCSIVVNHGDFASAGEAAAGFGRVDWFGSDQAGPTVCTESFAAMELRHYLCAIAGLDPGNPGHFPIRGDRESVEGGVIVVGSELSNRFCAAHAERLGFRRDGAPFPGPEGYRLVTVPKDGGSAVLIAGFDRVGTLYGVYEFLERCGVRWLSPGLGGEVVPRQPGLSIPALDRPDAPKFEIRGYLAAFYVPEHRYAEPQGIRGNRDFFNWMARNRMNFWNAGEEAVAPGELKLRGFHLGVGGHVFFRLLYPSDPYPYRHSGFPGGAGRPADPYPVSPDFRGDVNGDGVLSYSEAHPEWYGLGKDGKRHFSVTPYDYNFCTSNPGMVAELVKNLVEKLARGEWKNADYVRWAPEDIPGHWCVCENCRKLGTPTDRNLLMAHHIREGLKRARTDGRLARDIRVDFIIYPEADTMEPPTRPLPEGFDYAGIRGTFDPIHRCYVHGLDDPACTEFNRKFADYLKAWRENPFYKGQYEIVEYYNISTFHDLPILFTRTMARDIRYYYQNGARAMIYMHVPAGNWGPRALTNCQYARMLWNPAMDVAAFSEEYFRLRYGEVSTLMAEFYSALEKAMVNYPSFVSTPGGNRSPSNLSVMLRLFAQGKTKVLFPFRHLRMSGDHPPPDDGPSLEDSVAEIARAEGLLGQALLFKRDERIRAAILEDEGLFRFAAATIRLYDHLVRSTQFALRSQPWTREMTLASYQAEYLDSHPVGFAAFSGGTMGLMKNALEATDVKDVYLQWKALMP